MVPPVDGAFLKVRAEAALHVAKLTAGYEGVEYAMNERTVTSTDFLHLREVQRLLAVTLITANRVLEGFDAKLRDAGLTWWVRQ
jgi:hypothetical protein